MYDLSNLSPPDGARRKRMRRGRGIAAGKGKTCGRGHKGQNSRSGGGVPAGFEGGQMPLIRRIPKRGFKNPFRKEYALVKVCELSRFEDGSVIDAQLLLDQGLIRKLPKHGLKVLGNGEIKVALTVKANKFTNSAKEKLTAAGGKVEEI
ncbi:MAG: 50S ribosomal protein L15 [Candidatus Alcyoniella australis]|nr:50S ribosomal protein L15 [Candidatus Alcyoniella australis]